MGLLGKINIDLFRAPVNKRLKPKLLTLSNGFSFRRVFVSTLLLLVPFLGFADPNSTKVLLYNDSPFILTAIVQASDGSYLGQFTIQPGQQRNFTTNLNPTDFQSPGRPDISLTPYSVVWQCPSEGFFSLCTGASPGSLVRASDGSGPHFCSPKPKSDKPPPASSLKKSTP